ncbi:MAG TPA: DUF4157 domain-containing protein, partial [Longimicrobiaceae bacterium]|nr:DUF4157 domain-containing protein [Longimicrobiaceae bacterium]
FGADFGGVRLHEGAEAAAAAERLDARAFTYGSDIWLGAGAGEGDRRLMAHELTHVVQQGGGSAGTRVQRDPPPPGPTTPPPQPAPPPAQPAAPLPAPPTRVPVRIEFNAFIPGSLGSWLPEPGSPLGCQYRTDVRGFGAAGSSRIHTRGEFVSEAGGFSGCSAANLVGASHQRCPNLFPVPSFTPMGPAILPPFSTWTTATATAPNNGSAAGSCTRCGAHFDLVGEAAYPFNALSPDIDFDVDVDAFATAGGIEVRFSGDHNDFPAYEGIVEVGGVRTVVYSYMPTASGPGLINLNSTTTIPAGTRGTVAVSPVPPGCALPAAPGPSPAAGPGRRLPDGTWYDREGRMHMGPGLKL